MLDEVEDVALRLAERVPPAAAVVADDQDLAFSAAIFQRTPRALSDVELPAADHALENRGEFTLLATTGVRRRRTWRGAPGVGAGGSGARVRFS